MLPVNGHGLRVLLLGAHSDDIEMLEIVLPADFETEVKMCLENVGLVLRGTAARVGAGLALGVPLAVAAGATASGDWTIVTRDDGSMMWAYDGHPLYTFADDKTAGQVTGDGVDGFHLAK